MYFIYQQLYFIHWLQFTIYHCCILYIDWCILYITVVFYTLTVFNYRSLLYSIHWLLFTLYHCCILYTDCSLYYRSQLYFVHLDHLPLVSVSPCTETTGGIHDPTRNSRWCYLTAYLWRSPVHKNIMSMLIYFFKEYMHF